jgi:hypothetical protein
LRPSSLHEIPQQGTVLINKHFENEKRKFWDFNRPDPATQMNIDPDPLPGYSYDVHLFRDETLLV